MLAELTTKQLHAETGRCVRSAARSRTPTVITVRGQTTLSLRTRQILPEHAALMQRAPGLAVANDLDALRGDR